MKKIGLIFCLVILSGNILKAQLKADIGVIAGQAFYMGDVNHEKLFYSPGLMIGGLFRYNFNSRWAIRFMAFKTTLTGDDLDFDNEYQQQRAHSFETDLTDITTQMEFTFFPYTTLCNADNVSPFISLGATLLNSPHPSGSDLRFALPFSIGAKVTFTDRFSGGIEWSFRRTYTDYLDQLDNYDDTELSQTIRAKQRAFTTSDDWYSYAGIFLTYRMFRSRYKCPAYGNPLRGKNNYKNKKR